MKKPIITKELLSNILDIECISFTKIYNIIKFKHKAEEVIDNEIVSDIVEINMAEVELFEFIETKAISKGYSIVVGYDLKKKTYKGKVKWLYKCPNVRFCEVEKSSDYIYSDDKLEIWIKNYKWILEQ